jgi:hypothetical protein
MTIMLVVMGMAASLFSAALNKRHRESSRTDALTSAQAALNVISREIANSGYGLKNNGIILADSNNQKLHFLSNIKNTNEVTTDPSENITFYFDPTTESILRYDANANGVNAATASIIINRISSINFQYFDYSGSSSTLPLPGNTPTLNTSRIEVTVSVKLDDVYGEVANQSVVLKSDVSLRNSNYMLQQY